jgi:thiamine pyrophosphate-dependent acetolactate synthase large subunit-like protein
MTQDELLKQIEQKDKLLAEWLTWNDQEKTSQAELAQASADQLASSDKLIRDQAIVIAERTQERDEARKELNRQQVASWLEKALWGVAGIGGGYLLVRLTK